MESILKVLDAKAGWIQEDESKLLLRKALLSVERGTDESLRQYTTRKLAQMEAASAAALVTKSTTTWGTVLMEGTRLSKQSEQNLNTVLNGSTELDDVARTLNLLDVESQEGVVKAAVKPVVHSFMEAGRFNGDRQYEEEKQETDEQSGEEEHCSLWMKRWPTAGLHRSKRDISRTRAQAAQNRAEGPRQPRQLPRQSSTFTDSDGTPKDLRARLRKENRCFRCKKKGHWKAECPDKQHSKDGTAPAVFSGLTLLHTVEEESDSNAATWGGQCDEDTAWATGFPGVPLGHLTVDSAAGRWTRFNMDTEGLSGLFHDLRERHVRRCAV